MGLPVSRLRQWFALGAILMIATVAGMYFYARWRVRTAVHEVPAKIGLDIQQTAEGFSVSKSVEGRTLFTVSASKAVQFKGGGHAELHNVKIVVYGKDSSRFDRITGDDFEYDPASGDVSAKGPVLIDLEANPEGMRHSDQTPPEQTSDPIHLETNGLVFNKNTGNASATGKVVFQTPQASGSAMGIEYVAKTNTMNLLSAVVVRVSRPQAASLNADHGVISKQPRQIALTGVRLTREGQRLQSDQATFFLRDDNTVERVLAEGNVRSEFQGRALSKSSSETPNSKTPSSEAQARSDRAELFLAGVRNQLTTAVLSGNVQLATGDAASRVSTGGQSEGGQIAEASAGRVTLHFGGQQMLETVHAEDGVRLTQKKGESAVAAGPFDSPLGFARGSGKTGRLAGTPVAPLSSAPQSVAPLSNDAQEVEMTAPAMDFIVKDGRRLERAETSGPPQIAITQPGVNQKTVVTAAKFTAKFTEKNRLATLHGEPEARIVSSKVAEDKVGGAPGQDRVSTSQMLDVIFRPEGGVRSISQTGHVAYVDGPQKAWAERGEYTTADQMLVLGGSPRVVDNGMTTTAQTIRMSRSTGDAIAEGNVKSTYSDLKAQPEGGMFASSDPIHVASRSMTAHRSPAIAVYTGDARLWQNANVVEAPRLQFDRERRSLLASGESGLGTGLRRVRAGESPAPTQASPTQVPAQPVSTVLVQVDKSGKATPVRITSARLNYGDAERRIVLSGGVTAKGSDVTLTGQQMTVFLLPQGQTPQSPAVAGPGTPGQVERIVAEGKVVITQPTRHATGDRLVYTAGEDKFVLTGGSPSIFDAERGKITGDSLTFFRHDDRVLVEGRETSPTITKTQVAR